MAKRIDEIRQKVETEGEVFVSDLSRIYNVTEETIRRDLEKLKNDGIITRTFGGAVLNTTSQNDRVHFFKRKGINLEGKKKIAKLLVDKFIGVNTMMIDNSTTVLEAVQHFAGQLPTLCSKMGDCWQSPALTCFHSLNHCLQIASQFHCSRNPDII